MPDTWQVWHCAPSVPLCSESSWHCPDALQSGLRPENDVLPRVSRPVWHCAHGTFLCFLISGNVPFSPCAFSTIVLALPVRIVGSPEFRWQSRHSVFLYLPVGCCASLWTLACAWHDMHCLLPSKLNFSKSFGLLPRWQPRQVCSACLNLSSNLVRALWLKLLGVNFRPPDGWQVSHLGGEPNSAKRSPWWLSLAWQTSQARLGLASPSALVWHCSHLSFLWPGPRSNRVRSL